ncbi:hypothetical protein PHLGIDRAFT_128057 [Phlebiopsis gigantea 11061_1 CR5-6]|uniref:Transmembrane protein n=1 Tax=Phlebiopsis gigantea (strain 11061_1 CR5-6) TaxID=745531 RepID=A0A0C3S7K0_PHLG1|nr:hypothetical protein PHLGIDRAFT_128057 [Phlebiopsis gigantea 11061_1 CR5-6]
MASVLATIVHQPSGASMVTSTVSATEAPQPAVTGNQYDNNNGLRKISTIMPAFLIGFVCFLAIFLACGMYHSRRRRRMRQRFAFDDPVTEIIVAAQEAARQKKRKQRVSKPKLWEVDVKAADWERDLEALLPVAVELQHEPKPSPPPLSTGAPRARNWRRWFFEVLPRADQQPPPQPSATREMQQPPQQAQVAFIVSMPTPNRLRGQSSQEILLGTTQVPYRHDTDEDVDEPVNALARKLDEAIWISQ